MLEVGEKGGSVSAIRHPNRIEQSVALVKTIIDEWRFLKAEEFIQFVASFTSG